MKENEEVFFIFGASKFLISLRYCFPQKMPQNVQILQFFDCPFHKGDRQLPQSFGVVSVQ